jgi:hypothetical protein
MSSRARRAISQPSGPLPRRMSVIRPLKREGSASEFAQCLSALRDVADIEPGLYETFFQVMPDEPLVLYQQKRLCRRHPLAFSSRPSRRTTNTQDKGLPFQFARRNFKSLCSIGDLALIRRFQPGDETRVIPNLDHLPVEQLDSLFDRRRIIGALEDLGRLPHMIVFIEDVK